MRITINGTPECVETNSLITILQQKNISPDHVVVVINNVVIPQEQYKTTQVVERDCVEVLHFVSGG